MSRIKKKILMRKQNILLVFGKIFRIFQKIFRKICYKDNGEIMKFFWLDFTNILEICGKAHEKISGNCENLEVNAKNMRGHYEEIFRANFHFTKKILMK